MHLNKYCLDYRMIFESCAPRQARPKQLYSGAIKKNHWSESIGIMEKRQKKNRIQVKLESYILKSEI